MILSLIDSSGEHQLLNARDIMYIQTNGQGELNFYAYEEKYRAVSTLRDWAVLLQNEGFIQTDRGTIVNARKIDSYDPRLRVITIPLMNGNVSIPFAEKARRKLEEELSSVFIPIRSIGRKQE